MKINKTLLFFISLYSLSLYPSDQSSKDMITEEDKEWLNPNRPNIKLESLKDGFALLGTEEIIFDRLEKKIFEEKNNKLYHLERALKWCDFLKKNNKFKSHDLFNISWLMSNKEIVFFEGERDKILFKLLDYYTRSNPKSIEFKKSVCYFNKPTDINKILYFTHQNIDPVSMNGIISKLHESSKMPLQTIAEIVYNPIMYNLLNDNATCHSYKEVEAIDHLPLFLACFKDFQKKNCIKIPKVIIKYIIECYILKNHVDSFKTIKENAKKFKEYCNYIDCEIVNPEKEKKIYYDFAYISAVQMKEIFNRLKQK